MRGVERSRVLSSPFKLYPTPLPLSIPKCGRAAPRITFPADTLGVLPASVSEGPTFPRRGSRRFRGPARIGFTVSAGRLTARHYFFFATLVRFAATFFCSISSPLAVAMISFTFTPMAWSSSRFQSLGY